jgi:hypothetical protein
MCHTMGVLTHGGTSDGTDNPSSPSDGDADARAASVPLPDLWQCHVGSLSYSELTPRHHNTKL